MSHYTQNQSRSISHSSIYNGKVQISIPVDAELADQSTGFGECFYPSPGMHQCVACSWILLALNICCTPLYRKFPCIVQLIISHGTSLLA